MRLIVDRALFEPRSPGEALDLVRLLGTVAEDLEHHALITDPGYVLGSDNSPTDAWLDTRPPAEADALRPVLILGGLAAAGPRNGPSAEAGTMPRGWQLAGALEVRVTRRAASDWEGLRLTLADALALMREPLHLVLENERTDLSFVCHLAGPTSGPALRALLAQPGRVQTHGGGSGEGKMWLRALIEGGRTPEQWRRLLRAWVLFDQDAGDADVRTPSASSVELMEECEKVAAQFGVGPSWVCLRRREIESYIPDAGLVAEALPAQAALVQQVIAWRADPALAPLAWALDLKLGLRGDLVAGLPEATRKAVKAGPLALTASMLKVPFDALTPTEVAALASGLGKSRLNDALLRASPAPSWTADLPAEYDRGPAGQASRALLVQSLFDRI